MKHLHEHSPSALKFDGEQVLVFFYMLAVSFSYTCSFSLYRYTAKKNQDVKVYLMECIGDKFKDSASPRRIRSWFAFR